MTKKKQPAMTGDDACVCMHTALRKLCDSRITSAAYNFIHILCDMDELGDLNPWLVLGELVANQINKGIKPSAALVAASGHLDSKFSERANIARDKGILPLPRHAMSAMFTLTCMMDCFAEEDLEGMAGYLGD